MRTNLGSVCKSGRSIAAHSPAKFLSDTIQSMTKPLVVATGRNPPKLGALAICAACCCPGINIIMDSSIVISIWSPKPELTRPSSAVCIAPNAYAPVNISAIMIPDAGGRSFSPTCVSVWICARICAISYPLAAWATGAYAARCAAGPDCPKPEIEQYTRSGRRSLTDA